MKQVSDLVQGDQICLAEEIDFDWAEVTLHRPVTITVKSCVRMRDNSGDYAVAAVDANGRQWAERVRGEQMVNEPGDEVVVRLQEGFDLGIERLKQQVDTASQIGKMFADEMLKELSHDHSEPNPS